MMNMNAAGDLRGLPGKLLTSDKKVSQLSSSTCRVHTPLREFYRAYNLKSFNHPLTSCSYLQLNVNFHTKTYLLVLHDWNVFEWIVFLTFFKLCLPFIKYHDSLLLGSIFDSILITNLRILLYHTGNSIFFRKISRGLWKSMTKQAPFLVAK